MPYEFDHIDARDPSNPAVRASNAAITIFEVGDASKTPVTLTTVDGLPYPNPVTTTADGYGPRPVHATLDRLAWEGGGFAGVMYSYKGMKDEAVAARSAAETAAADAAAAAASLATGAVHFVVSATEPTETTTADGKPVVWIDTSGTTSSDTTAPSAVAGLTAGTPTETTVPLSWTAATDNIAVTGYEYSLNGTTWTSTGSTGTTYTVMGLTQGTSYTIQVRAFDAAGNRGTSASVTKSTTASSDTTAPTAPTNLAGTAGQTTMDLSWTASTDAVGVTGCRVSKDNGATWITSAVTGTTYQVTGLTAGTSYTFAVAARDAAGNWSTNATLTKSTAAAVTYNSAVLADAPTYYLPLDDAAGTTTPRQLGSSAATATVVQGVTFGAASLGDGATSATFSNGKITIPKIGDGSMAFTVEALVKSTGAYGYTIAETAGSNLGWKFTGKEAYIGNTYVTAPNSTAGTIHHVALTFDGATVRYYLDGAETGAVARTTAIPTASGTDMVIGMKTDASLAWPGELAGIAVYASSALSAARVLAHAQAAGRA